MKIFTLYIYKPKFNNFMKYITFLSFLIFFNSIIFSQESANSLNGYYNIDIKTKRTDHFSKYNTDNIGWEGHLGAVYSVTYSKNDSIIASGGSDGTIRFWNAGNGNLIRVIKAHSDEIFSICFSPDGKLIASGGYEGFMKIWNVEDGSLIKSFELYNPVKAVVFSHDGKLLATSEGGEAL